MENKIEVLLIDNMKIGDKLILPNNLCITPIGLKSIPYQIVSYKIDLLYTENGTKRIILKRGKKLHDKYMDTVNELLSIINNKCHRILK